MPNANANNPVYGNLNAGGVNAYGFKPLSVQDKDQQANFLQSGNNFAAQAGGQNVKTGIGTTQAGVNSLAPVFDYLTRLTKGDQGDVSQAIQPEANRIRDSFQAARNMISSQARGGGKAGVLAESQFKEKQATGDLAAQARQGAAGELGKMGSTLAGVGLEEQAAGEKEQALALSNMLQQRNQNMTSGSFASQFSQIAQGINALV